jgi:hypothetical protein
VRAGTENKSKTRAAIILCVAAVLLCAYEFWPSSNQRPSSAPPVAQQRGGRGTAVFSKLDPSLRLDLLKGSEDVTYQGSGRDIFHAQAEPAKEDTPDVGKADVNPLITSQPLVHTNPPIPLKFYGFASANNRKQIFLSEGEDIFVAKEGDIVKGRYKVLHVNPNNVEIEDVLSNYSQQIPLSMPNS